jgi:hypothetical protein
MGERRIGVVACEGGRYKVFVVASDDGARLCV